MLQKASRDEDQQRSVPRNVQRPSDLRRARRTTERQLVIGAVVIAFVVGGGLIWAFWGLRAMLTSWLCLGSVVVPIGAIYLALKLMERWGRSPPDDE